MTSNAIRLECVDASLPTVRLDPERDRPGVLGRSRDLLLCVPHGSISRRHCEIAYVAGHVAGHVAGQWFVKDLGSLNGTWIDGNRLKADAPTRLTPGCILRLGEVDFVVQPVSSAPSVFATVAKPSDRISPVSRDRDGDAARVLQILLHYAALADGADSESDLAEAMARAAMSVGQFSRVAVVKPGSDCDEIDRVEVLASVGPASNDRLSSTLLREAVRQAAVVRLDSSPDMADAVSVVGLKITSALCVPVLVGSTIRCLLYADIRDDRPGSVDRAAPVCEAIAQLGGLGLASQMRAASEQAQLRLEAEVDAARLVQQRLLPPSHGAIGPVRYALKLEPGRGVAGDLIGMTPVGDNATAFFLGDVSGKGLAAGLLMSRVQAELEALLSAGFPLVETVGRVNRRLAEHSADNQFVTLWIGVIDHAGPAIRYIDAGHGYAAHAEASSDFELITGRGGIPLGIDPFHEYREDSVVLEPGSALAIVSDGAIEQADHTGDQLGVERLFGSLGGPGSLQQRVEHTAEAVQAWAGTTRLDDDLSV
ncbi:MAG: SpoIIE family protein phosphatase, partial [Planctomycetota bacterium]